MIAARAMSKVLVIDDELGPRESVRFLLKNDFEVLCADCVDRGVELLKLHSPDLVIMDLRMPGKSGIDGLREIRELDPAVSVVVLTGYGALETAKEALRLGANDYQSKPFDTTELKRIAHKYASRTVLERKRTHMVGELEAVNQRLASELASKKELAMLGQSSAEFVHDLRNPLMIVSGYVELLTRRIERAKDTMGEEYKETGDYLDAIETNLHRCIDLARLWQDLGKSELVLFKPTSVAQLMDDLRAGIQPMASAENVSMEYRLEPNGAVVYGSRAQLIRALHNIAANAVQATSGDNRQVRVTCRRAEPDVQIRIEDNGIGMSAATMAKIFTPYFSTKANGGGTGLGMGIAKKILEEHDGDIHVESEEGLGTRITLRLPLMDEARIRIADGGAHSVAPALAMAEA